MDANEGVVRSRVDKDPEQRRVEPAAWCLLSNLRCSPPAHHHITSLAAPAILPAGSRSCISLPNRKQGQDCLDFGLYRLHLQANSQPMSTQDHSAGSQASSILRRRGSRCLSHNLSRVIWVSCC